MSFILKLAVTGGAAAGAVIVNTTGSLCAWATVMLPRHTEKAKAKRAQCVRNFMVYHL